jgi:hypothetical protein
MKACRQCGLENEEGTSFCGNCGEFLGWEQAPGDEAHPAPPVAPVTDPATPGEPGNLLQQARVGLHPDLQPDAAEQRAPTVSAQQG